MILVTNDDGIGAPGIRHLAGLIAEIDEPFVVAPDRERSGVGMAITLDRPLRATARDANGFAVDGTPVDCVDLAVGELLPETPRLCVAGINMGQNLGHDVHFSGTVAAARKATFLGIPSIAFSMPRGDGWHFDTASAYVVAIVRKALTRGIPTGVLLNVNIPNVEADQVAGVRVTRQDVAPYDSHVLKRVDKFGEPYYWIGGARQDADGRDKTDFVAVSDNFVSVTPLQSDMTAGSALDALANWNLDV